jgi:hypothetical protein
MAIRIAALPEGTRVRVVRGAVPQDPRASGRAGTVVASSEYRHNQAGVLLDGEQQVRFFLADELEVTDEVPPAPERIAAKQRKALP